MKKFMCLLAVAALMSGSAFSQELRTTKRGGAAIPPAPKVEPSKGAPEAKKAPAGKTIKGDIVSVMTYCTTGKATALTKDQAADMAKRGEMLGVLSAKKLYLIVNADGTSAASKLAKGGSVTVTGKVLSKGGVNLVAANTVE